MKSDLKRLTINYLGKGTVCIDSRELSFMYNDPKQCLKEEFWKDCRYFGGLQCNYEEGTEKYKELESKLCDIAESLLKQIEE